jgi:hypothetical protein
MQALAPEQDTPSRYPLGVRRSGEGTFDHPVTAPACPAEPMIEPTSSNASSDRFTSSPSRSTSDADAEIDRPAPDLRRTAG